MLSQCLQRSWHFQYKIFTLPLVIPTFISFVAICYYRLENSEHIKNGIRTLKLLSTQFYLDTGGEKENAKVWHMLVSSLQMSPPSEEFRGIVFRDTETLTKMNPLSHQDEAVSNSISWQCAVRVSRKGKQTHHMWKKSLLFTTASQSKKTGNWCLTNVFKRHWLINPFHSIPFNEWKKKI